MIASLEETGRLDASPWEPFGSLRDGRGQFFSCPRIVVGWVPAKSAGRLTEPSKKRRGADPKPGMTRRGVVYEYVREHPGSHIRGMCRELGIATGDLQYHLSWLERRGFVKTRKSGFYRFAFPTMVFNDEQETLLAVISLKTPREILLSLLSDPSVTQGELARRLGFSQPTVSWHMGRLARLGVIRKSRTRNGSSSYEVAADRGILSLVRSYHPEVWKRWAGRLATCTAAEGEVAGPAENGGPLQGAKLAPPALVELIGKR